MQHALSPMISLLNGAKQLKNAIYYIVYFIGTIGKMMTAGIYRRKYAVARSTGESLI